MVPLLRRQGCSRLPRRSRRRPVPGEPFTRTESVAMILAKPRCRDRSAIAAVEFAVLLPLILTLVVGLWEVGRLVDLQQLLTNAAREGGRQAASGERSTATVTQAVIKNRTSAGR